MQFNLLIRTFFSKNESRDEIYQAKTAPNYHWNARVTNVERRYKTKLVSAHEPVVLLLAFPTTRVKMYQ